LNEEINALTIAGPVSNLSLNLPEKEESQEILLVSKKQDDGRETKVNNLVFFKEK
jgi:hypothetical protein